MNLVPHCLRVLRVILPALFCVLTPATEVDGAEIEEAILRIPFPPNKVLDGVVSLKVQVTKESARRPFAEKLKALVERALATDYIISANDPDAVVTLNVIAFDAPSGDRVTEKRICYKLPNGRCLAKPKCLDFGAVGRWSGLGTKKTCITTEVPEHIEYWQGRGELSLKVTLTSQRGSAEDNFTIDHRFNKRVETRANGLNSGNLPPQKSELLDLLLKGAAEAVQAQYCYSFREQLVILSNADELEPGNDLAKLGRWEEAYQSFKRAIMNNRAEQLYSLGLASEGSAFQIYEIHRNTEAARPRLAEAETLYRDASNKAPKDVKIRQRQAHLAVAQSAFEQILRLEALNRNRSPETVVLATDADGKGLSSPEAEKFRANVRNQLQTFDREPPPKEVQSELVGTAQLAFKLSADAAQQIVAQEMQTHVETQKKLDNYRSTFARLVKDKVIQLTDREQLDEIKKGMELSDVAVKTVEVEFRPFREAGVPDNVTPAVVARPPAPKAPPPAPKISRRPDTGVK